MWVCSFFIVLVCAESRVQWFNGFPYGKNHGFNTQMFQWFTPAVSQQPCVSNCILEPPIIFRYFISSTVFQRELHEMGRGYIHVPVFIFICIYIYIYTKSYIYI